MGYESSLLNSDNFKRKEIVEAVEIERALVIMLLRFLARTGHDNSTTLTVVYSFDSKIEKRMLDLFERTKDEILAT